jgi:autotransporter adhesin
MRFNKTTLAAAALLTIGSPAFAGTLLCNYGSPGNLATANGGINYSVLPGGSTYGPTNVVNPTTGEGNGPIGFIAGATASTSCPAGYTEVGYAATTAELTSLISAGSTGNPNAVIYNNGGTSANPNTVTVANGVNGTDATNVDQLNAGMASTLGSANSYTDSKVAGANQYTDSQVSNAINVSKSYTDSKVAGANQYTDQQVSNAITVSRSYTDSQITDAREYTDQQVAGAINISEAYTDQKTKYFAANSSGPASVASGTDTIAIGPGTQVTGDNSIGAGAWNLVTGTGSGAFGGSNAVSGNGSYVQGNNNTVGQDNSFVVGNNVTTTQANSVVLGNGSMDRAATTVTGTTINGTAYDFAGAGSSANGVVSVGAAGAERQIINVAPGELSATSTDAVNGSQLNATNQAVNRLGANVDNLGNSTAMNFGGGSAYDPVTGAVSAPRYVVNNVAYNNVGSALNAVGSTVAGNNTNGLPPASATGSNSVAVGAGSVADRANTVSFGAPGAERQLTNVAPGIAPTDAVNLGQARAMVGNSVQQANAYTDQAVQALDTKTRKEMAGVGALARASSALVPNARAEGNASVSMAAGTYGGQSAVAVGVNYYASNQILLTSKIGVTSAGPSKVGFAVGATIGF